MKHGWSAIRWTLEKLLRLAAAATALSAMPAMIVAFIIFKPATTLGLIAALGLMMIGFIAAILVVIASAAFWRDKSKQLKTPLRRWIEET